MPQYQTKLSDDLFKNVATILNKDSNKGSSAGINIKEYPEYSNYHISCVFNGKDANKKPFSISPLRINKLFLSQDFTNAYMDNIELNVSMRSIEFLAIFYGYQELTCDLTLRYAHPVSGIVKGLDEGADGDPAYIFEGYKVIFKDKQDLRKKLPKESIIPNEGETVSPQQSILLTDVSFQLIPPEEYKLRVTSFSFQLTESTVKDAILFIAHSCGIKKIALVEPDNKETLCNLTIPPTQTFFTALIYLQERYGIYDKDIGFYYTDNTLFIYPRYETSPSMPSCPDEDTPTFYFVGGGKFLGLEVNHAKDVNNTTHIVINTATINVDKVDAGIENDGTGVLIVHADKVIDKWRSIDEATSVSNARLGLGKMNIYKNMNTELFALDPGERKKLGIDPSVSIIKYRFDEGNVHKCRVPINSYKQTTINTTWDNAVVYTFRPGYKILWNYDDEDKKKRDMDEEVKDSQTYTTKTGCVDRVHYEFSMLGRPNNRDLHRCVANIQLALEADFGDDTSEGGASSDIDETDANKNIGRDSSYKLAETRGPVRECRPMQKVFYIRTTDESKLTADERVLKRQLEAEDKQRLLNNGTVY